MQVSGRALCMRILSWGVWCRAVWRNSVAICSDNGCADPQAWTFPSDVPFRWCAELRREGTTIHSDVEISYVDAILGVTIPVRTVDGQVRVSTVKCGCAQSATGCCCLRERRRAASS